MTVGSLFAGIGGFDLGFERAGFEIKWQVEIDPFCRAVLAKHWPGVRRYEDVRTVHEPGMCRDVPCEHCLPRVDVLVGGFPCQDISVAGAGAGIGGARSGLWSEYARIVSEIRPAYVVVENVSALLGRGLGRVLGDLATLGYDAEWDCIPASALRAPHQRDRVWIVAYPNDQRKPQPEGREQDERGLVSHCGKAMAYPYAPRSQERLVFAGISPCSGRDDDGQDAALGDWWAIEPNVGRVAHGVPNRVDRLRGLGNSIVPQIAEWIARRIIEAEGKAA